ncbi:ABC transporter permease [Alkaliphilus hydrothermalis]|uniref:Sodium transport system permease protein n=1 Tax=Alkaliphilus hydrothermalis TaxID=1482730 RepID=A0ABS2NRC2_9FIRM|nr:ABC transporter permease [Alkaliphilus hydrothermalis]MBM7615332.1 sodium transport system permease protein [Alkaliphilus hydrothermalis]
MNYKHIAIVLKKELKDIFRDKRTWLAGVLIPVMVFPLMFYLMGMGRSKMENNLKQDIPIAIEAQGEESQLISYIKNAEGLKVMKVEDAYESLKAGEIKTIIHLEEGFEEKIKGQIPANVKLIYDEVSSESTMATATVQNVIMGYTEGVRLGRLAELGIDPQKLQPTIINREAYVPEGEESKGGGEALMLLTFLLPFLLMLYPVIGGMPAAIDLGAGEKERLSLEPLLSTGADRLSILVGKYLTILLASVIGVITSLAGLVVSAKMNPDMMPMELSISPISILILVGVSMLIAMMLSGVMLAISVFAKSYKEAGTYLSPITIVLMVPAYLTMFMDLRTISTNLFFIPILNAVLLMKEVLVDIINPVHIAITFSMSFALVVASLLFTKYMFNKESVIFRS